jgi:hypothetical protein
MPMAEENTDQFLSRRQRELIGRIAALRGQLSPLETELEKVTRMRALLAEEPSGIAPPVTINALPSGVSNAAVGGALGLDQFTSQPPFVAMQKYEAMTIKELVVQALLDSFPHAATTAQLREFISNGYGREIEQSSLRPQLHRLKADSILFFDSNERWNLNPEKGRLYSRYNHPTSRAAMPELKDDPVEGNYAARLRPFMDHPDRDGNGEPDKG